MSQKVITIQKFRGQGSSSGKRKATVFESEFKKNKKGRYNDWIDVSDIKEITEETIEVPVGSTDPDPIIVTEDINQGDELDLSYHEYQLKKLKKNDLGDILNGMDVEFDLTIRKDELIKLIIDNQ